MALSLLNKIQIEFDPELLILIIPDINETRRLETTRMHVDEFSRAGLRTLVVAKRIVPEDELKTWSREYLVAETTAQDSANALQSLMDKIERDFTLLGVTGIEDRLQEGVPETIECLREAGIHVWVLTGDKQETAVNVAHAAHLITDEHKLIYINASSKKRMHIRNLQGRRASVESSKLALVIDGETLQFALEEDMKGTFLRLARLCTSVLCCRSTPSQKASVVSLVKKGLSVQTLAIGDGANDVNMIQVADVGVGIGGEEGMQAVMASDFAISRFRFLRRLVLVHGHLCYDKLAHTALYLFYKDGVYIFLLFWFQLFNGFSGSNAVDQLSQILFSITMTGLPPFLMGIWDNPIDPDTLMQNPVLYRSGIKGKAYRPWLFWINILDAVWQSLIIFFIPYLFHADSTMTLWRFGVLQMNILVLCSLIHAALETRTWVFLHWIGLIFSYLFAWVFFTMVYHALAVRGIAPENPYFVIFVAMNDSTFWLLTVITTVAALLPRLLFITLNNMLNPSLGTVANLMTRIYGRGKRLPLEAYLAGYPVSLSPVKRHSPVDGTSISSGLSHITLPATTPDGLQVQGGSQPSLPSANMEDLETPTHFISRMEQLFSVGGRLFRGVPPSSHLPSTAAPVSPISMINLRHSPGFVVDSRRRRRRTQTINYGYDRPSVRYGTRGSNNFDDEAGPPSTPGIWPAVDPHVRAHSLSGPRHLGHRNRPAID
ncbi:phospholipid-translocating ATPase, partial [Clonorchis sinensis]